MRNKTTRRPVDSLRHTVPTVWLRRTSLPQAHQQADRWGRRLPYRFFFTHWLLLEFGSSLRRCGNNSIPPASSIFDRFLVDGKHTSHSEGEACMGEKSESGEGRSQVVQMDL